jgi:hypothetical protein
MSAPRYCSIIKCLRPIHAKGLCKTHYDRKRYGSGLPENAPIGKRGRPKKSETSVNFADAGLSQTDTGSV